MQAFTRTSGNLHPLEELFKGGLAPVEELESLIIIKSASVKKKIKESKVRIFTKTKSKICIIKIMLKTLYYNLEIPSFVDFLTILFRVQRFRKNPEYHPEYI